MSLAAAACGGDDGDDTFGAEPGGVPDTTGGVDSDCPDHPAVTAVDAGGCAVSASLLEPVTEDLTLTSDIEWFLGGPLVIGDDVEETTLTIEPGTTVKAIDGSFVLIQRNSTIMAEGTVDAPIVFTSALEVGSRSAADWGGLVINGNAPINNGGAAGEAPGEAGTGIYGGSDSLDSSGILNYVRVEFAGNQIDTENELNGIAFQGVGSGTEVDFVQVHLASDDGIEFFGGTVNVKHVVITGSDDDSIDWTGGWQGNAQFVIAEQLAESGTEAERGIEGDNLEGNDSATPFSDPALSNVTLIARDGNPDDGLRLRRGTRGQLFNFIVTGFDGNCITVTEAQTILNINDAELNTDNFVLDCGQDADANGAALLTGQNTISADPMLVDWQPQAGSPALEIGTSISNAFIEETDYAGAFDGTTDWSDGWIESALN